MLNNALTVSRKMEENGIDYCLIGGSLIGAVRQKAFAGRPSDFDIAIKEVIGKKFSHCSRNF